MRALPRAQRFAFALSPRPAGYSSSAPPMHRILSPGPLVELHPTSQSLSPLRSLTHLSDEDTERSTARRRTGNDMLMEPSKQTLPVGVQMVAGASASGVGFHILATRNACGLACNPSIAETGRTTFGIAECVAIEPSTHCDHLSASNKLLFYGPSRLPLHKQTCLERYVQRGRVQQLQSFAPSHSCGCASHS